MGYRSCPARGPVPRRGTGPRQADRNVIAGSRAMAARPTMREHSPFSGARSPWDHQGSAAPWRLNATTQGANPTPDPPQPHHEEPLKPGGRHRPAARLAPPGPPG
jgi:hypothetical protein